MEKLIIKALVALAIWALVSAFKKALSAEEAPVPELPPALPRRSKRTRQPIASSREAAPEVDPPPAALAPHITDEMMQVTRPAHARVSTDFRGRGALRRAIIAQEVLGPPLALRPPRS